MNDLNPLYKQKSGRDEELFKICSAEELLSEESFKHIITDLQKDIAIPQTNFEDVYLSTIFRFAELIQSLPNTKHHNFGFAKGHLLLALLRSGITIRESENFPCPMLNHKFSSAQVEEKRMAIWHYIIFSSALFMDIGKIINSLQVETCDENHDNKQPWQPLEGTMISSSNSHYIRRITALMENTYTNKLNVVFALNTIPKYILSWMSEEPDLFFEWLCVLEDQASGSGTLHKLTMVSLRKLINEYMGSNLPQNILKLIPKHILAQKQYHKDSFWRGVEHSLRGEKTFPRDAEQNYGAEFLTWLREGINSKSISVNQKESKVHIASNGLFAFSPEIFLEFSKQSPKHTNWQTAFKQLHESDVLTRTTGSTIFEANFPNLDPSHRRGVLISNTSWIFGNEAAPNLSPQIETGSMKPVPISALFPSPKSREEVGVAAYMRYIYNPKPL